MKYYIDTEFNGFGGDLLSLGIINEDGKCWYFVKKNYNVDSLTHWVYINVHPIMLSTPEGIETEIVTTSEMSYEIWHVLKDDKDPVIITDWPDDIKYFSQLLITSPGQMIKIPGIKFEMHRVDSYPNDIKDIKQHNALWDAIALRYKLTGKKNYYS